MKRLTASFALVTSVLTMPIPAVLAWNIQGHILSGAIAYQIMQRESPIVITTTLILKPAVMPLGFYKLSSRSSWSNHEWCGAVFRASVTFPTRTGRISARRYSGNQDFRLRRWGDETLTMSRRSSCAFWSERSPIQTSVIVRRSAVKKASTS